MPSGKIQRAMISSLPMERSGGTSFSGLHATTVVNRKFIETEVGLFKRYTNSMNRFAACRLARSRRASASHSRANANAASRSVSPVLHQTCLPGSFPVKTTTQIMLRGGRRTVALEHRVEQKLDNYLGSLFHCQ
jgi:hypothetical protein